MMFVVGVGLVGCGSELEPAGTSFVEPAEQAEPDETPSNSGTPDEMEPTVEMPPDEMPPDVVIEQRPDASCTDNLVAEEPYGAQLPGWDRYEFTVQIAEDTRSFQIVGFSERDNGALLEQMTTPSAAFDFWTDDTFSKLLGTWYQVTEGNVSALTMPVDATQLGALETGEYTFHGLSRGGEFCYYVVEDTAPGATLQLNIFFVGVAEIDAQTAPQHEDWQEVEQVVANTFAAAGVDVLFNYVALPDAVRTDHGSVFTFGDLDAAVWGAVDAVDPLPMRSIDVFLWDEFDGEVASMHGMARGVPEAVGLHGERGNGVTLQMLDMLGFEGILGNFGEVVGNIEIGLTISHEVGHLLGLFHTSELHAAVHDGFDDTPQCENPSQTLDACPDAGNLMFPFGPFYASSELSDLQVAAITAHPSLIRE